MTAVLRSRKANRTDSKLRILQLQTTMNVTVAGKGARTTKCIKICLVCNTFKELTVLKRPVFAKSQHKPETSVLLQATDTQPMSQVH